MCNKTRQGFTATRIGTGKTTAGRKEASGRFTAGMSFAYPHKTMVNLAIILLDNCL